MNAPTVRIPAPTAGDSSAVTHALELACALWDKGNHGDAIRWVRHAIEAADEAGDVARVAVLARAVADLGAASAPAAPPSRRPPPASIRPTAPPPSTRYVPPPISVRPPPLPGKPASPPSGTMPRTPPPPALRPPPPRRSGPPTPSAPSHGELRRRVSVKTSVRDPSLLVVRPLAEGQSAPPGTREAFLIMAEDADAADPGRSKPR
jgi:hypothetical protein